MRLFVRLSLIGLVALVAVGFWFNQNPSQQAPSTTEVSQGLCLDQGTSLVIDFGTGSQQPVIAKCVKNFSGTSWNLLSTAGLKIAGTEKYPVGFLCRINDFPSKEVEKCIDTPGTTNGSWAFFIAEDSTWTYAAIGAASHKSKCGSTEGWRFLLPDESLDTFPRLEPKNSTCEK